MSVSFVWLSFFFVCRLYEYETFPCYLWEKKTDLFFFICAWRRLHVRVNWLPIHYIHSINITMKKKREREKKKKMYLLITFVVCLSHDSEFRFWSRQCVEKFLISFGIFFFIVVVVAVWTFNYNIILILLVLLILLVFSLYKRAHTRLIWLCIRSNTGPFVRSNAILLEYIFIKINHHWLWRRQRRRCRLFFGLSYKWYFAVVITQHSYCRRSKTKKTK